MILLQEHISILACILETVCRHIHGMEASQEDLTVYIHAMEAIDLSKLDTHMTQLLVSAKTQVAALCEDTTTTTNQIDYYYYQPD